MSQLQIYNPLMPAIAQADSDNQLVELWLRSHRSEKTRKEYARDMATFASFLDCRGVNGMQATRLAHLQDYAESLTDKSPNTQRRMLASIKSLFSFAHKLGYVQFNVAAAIQLPRAKNVLAERILSEADVLKMIVLEPSPRNQLLIRLLYVSAARLSECRSLRWRDLQSRGEGGQVTLYGKGEKTRAMRLPAKLWADLEVRRGRDDDFLFPRKKKRDGSSIIEPLTASQLWRVVAKAAQRAGITKKVSPHWLRHAHASHAIERGANLAIVKESLGHASLAVTSAYTHARPEDSSSLYLTIE